MDGDFALHGAGHDQGLRFTGGNHHRRSSGTRFSVRHHALGFHDDRLGLLTRRPQLVSRILALDPQALLVVLALGFRSRWHRHRNLGHIRSRHARHSRATGGQRAAQQDRHHRASHGPLQHRKGDGAEILPSPKDYVLRGLPTGAMLAAPTLPPYKPDGYISSCSMRDRARFLALFRPRVNMARCSGVNCLSRLLRPPNRLSM